MERFTDLGNGVIRDTKTGLEWQAESVCPMPWQGAMDYAASLYREALHALCLNVARRLLDLGIPAEEILLRGDGSIVTIARDYQDEAKGA